MEFYRGGHPDIDVSDDQKLPARDEGSQIGQHYLHKFSLHRANRKWSRMNRDKAEELIHTGRMQPAGYRQVKQAKINGRWEAAYEPQSQITIPDNFQDELNKNELAKEFFLTRNSHNRYVILHRIQEAKKPATTTARIH